MVANRLGSAALLIGPGFSRCGLVGSTAKPTSRMTLRLFENDNQVAQLTTRTKRRYVSSLKPKRDHEDGTLCHFRGVEVTT